jgi:hypothetical protein
MRSFALAGVVAACGLALAAADGPAISADNLRSHLQFLSADGLRGRSNGSGELELAADYRATVRSGGLRPGAWTAGSNRSSWWRA